LTPAQVAALEARYLAALDDARHAGVSDEQIATFERLVANSRAVVNVDHEYLRFFARNESLVYSACQLMISENSALSVRQN
jgi:hypothetical protein